MPKINGIPSISGIKRKAAQANEMGMEMNGDEQPQLKKRRISGSENRRKNGSYRQRSIKEWCSLKQTPLERMNIRNEYRSLEEETKAERVNLINSESRKFIELIDKQDEIYTKVLEPTEAMMDINQCALMSNMVKTMANKLANQNFTITCEQFISSIIKNYTNEDELFERDINFDGVPIHWDKLGKHSLYDFINTAPNMKQLNGVSIINSWGISKEEKEEEEKKKKRISKIMINNQENLKKRKNRWITDAEQKKGELITFEYAKNNINQTETKTRITSLNKFLRKKCGISKNENSNENENENENGYPIKLWSFIINPNSFSQTIENIFDLSFIINQGNALIAKKSNNEQPFVKFMTQKQKKENKNVYNSQCIVKMDYNMFKNVINCYNINESQIKRKENNNNNKKRKRRNNRNTQLSDDNNSNSDDCKDLEYRTQLLNIDDPVICQNQISQDIIDDVQNNEMLQNEKRGNGKREIDDESDSE